jgi:hypothetical protein
MSLLKIVGDEVKVSVDRKVLNDLVAVAEIRIDIDFRFRIVLSSDLNKFS